MVKVFHEADSKPIVGRVQDVTPEGIIVKPQRGPAFIAQAHEIEVDKSVARLDTPPLSQPRGARNNPVQRAGDRRKLQGQTPSNFFDHESGVKMEKTHIGDVYEQVFYDKGMKVLEDALGSNDFQELSHASTAITGSEKRAARNTPLDFRIGNNGVELKTLSVLAKNQKAAIKTDERIRKENEVKKHDWGAVLVVQVVDQKTGVVKVYLYHGFESKQVKAMKYVGEYKYNKRDYVKAKKKRYPSGFPKEGVVVAAVDPAEDADPVDQGWTDETGEEILPGDTVVELGPDGVPTISTAGQAGQPIDTVTQ